MFQINLHGDQLDKKTEEQLMEEMFKLAVVAQNNLVQDRDESVRSYLWCFWPPKIEIKFEPAFLQTLQK